jgi:uncharacterized NAD(P)/FAD-binding protein YdhS
MHFGLAIIGGGLTATSMLCQFVDKVREKAQKNVLDPSNIKIQIYEMQDIFGPGFPHNERFALPCHITNMCASDMGILDRKPGDFQDWVTSNADNLRERFSWFRNATHKADFLGDQYLHYPRAVMGAYLEARFQEAVDCAQKVGLAVSLYPNCEVVDLRPKAGKIYLKIKNLLSDRHFSSDADRVLLATGHWFEKNNENHYFSSPWPADQLHRSIPKGEKVAIIGTSLSAIETLLTLTSEGEFTRSRTGEMVYTPPESSRTLFLYSRRGLLPKVTGKMGHYKNKYLNRANVDRLLSENPGTLALNAIFKLLNLELEEAYGLKIDWEEVVNPTAKPVDLLQRYLEDAVYGDGPNGELIWQTILHQSFDRIREIYLNLTIEDRKRFDENYTSVFFTYAATQPLINAEKLLALMKAGIVDVVKLGENYRLKKSEVRDCYEFIYSDNRGNFKKDAYRYVVNARGQEKSLETNPSILAKNLIKSGTVQIEEIRPIYQKNQSRGDSALASKDSSEAYKTGSIWIDPDTQQIMKMGPGNKVTKNNAIYAVGAMTRGQIINASMVRGIAKVTSRIADELVNHLIRRSKGPEPQSPA